jgi:glycosyltransferase involved in cell wall biosynthesis
MALLAASWKGLPVLFYGETVGGTKLPLWKQTLLKIFFRNVKAFLAIGSQSLAFYRELSIPEARLFLAPYSVDSQYYIRQSAFYRAQKEELKAKLGIPERLPVILCVSMLIPRKRPMDLLMVFQQLRNKAVLVFVGDGPLKRSLEDYTSAAGLQYVLFLGFCPPEEIPQYYAIADIFVLPSSYEPWGLVVNEAACCCLPIVTTSRVASAADLVRHGRNGFVYPAGDVESLIHYLNLLLADPLLRQEMGEASLSLVSNWGQATAIQVLINALHFVYSAA